MCRLRRPLAMTLALWGNHLTEGPSQGWRIAGSGEAVLPGANEIARLHWAGAHVSVAAPPGDDVGVVESQLIGDMIVCDVDFRSFRNFGSLNALTRKHVR